MLLEKTKPLEKKNLENVAECSSHSKQWENICHVPKAPGVHTDWNIVHHSYKDYKYLLIVNLLIYI